MKILIISDAWHPQINGVVRTYEHLCTALQAMGHETRVIGPADFPHTYPMPGYNEIKLTLRPYKRLAAMIEAYGADDIHIATEGPLGWSARKYCMRNNLKFTTTYHTHFPDYVVKRLPRVLSFLETPVRNVCIGFIKKFHSASNAMAVATPSVKETLQSWGVKTPMHIMTRGIDTKTFYPPKNNAPASHPELNDLPRPICLYVGRVAVEKNIEAFLDTEIQGTKIVVGDGPALDRLQDRYKTAVFLGKRTGKQLADIYRAGDVFVFPSKTDTFGIVIIEALACGLPVAGYDVTGPRDIITNSIFGAIHENDLKIAVEKALMENGARQKRAELARKSYSWNRAAQQFLSLSNIVGEH